MISRTVNQRQSRYLRMMKTTLWFVHIEATHFPTTSCMISLIWNEKRRTKTSTNWTLNQKIYQKCQKL